MAGENKKTRKYELKKPRTKEAQEQQRANAEEMRANYMSLHNSGMTNRQIAEMYDLDISTIYDSLEKIAAENGVTRDSLLDKNSKKTNVKESAKENGVEKINGDDTVKTIRKGFETVRENLNNLIESVSSAIEKGENDYE